MAFWQFGRKSLVIIFLPNKLRFATKRGGEGMKTHVRTQMVIVVAQEIGIGTPDYPCRPGLKYFDMDGNLLFTTDAMPETEITYVPKT